MAAKLLELIRHAARRLGRSPGYALPVIISLALGVGLNTAIFAVTQDVLRRPLPYPDESELLTVGKIVTQATTDPGGPSGPDWQTYDKDFKAWQQGSRTLESIAIFSAAYRVVEGGAGPEYATGGTASTNLLRVLRTRPMRGRWFADDEQHSRVVVLGEELWHRQFADDSNVVGRTLKIQGEPWTVIGVMPRGVGLPLGAGYWVPFDNFGGQVVARLRVGIPLSAVDRELTMLSPSVANAPKWGSTVDLVVTPLHEQLFGSARPALKLLSAAAVLLLLIACANIANLSLARTMDRRRELAVRVALGASRRSLAGLVLTENFLLALLGAGLGIMLALWGTDILVAVAPSDITRVRDIGVNWTGALFAAALAMLAGLVVSLGPVITVTNRGVQPILGQASAQAGRGRVLQRVRRMLVAAQLALTLLLMSGAGLLIRSVARLTRADHLGFAPHGVVIANVNLFGDRYRDSTSRVAFVNDLTARMKALPGVQSVGIGPAPLVAGSGAEGFREGFNGMFTYSDSRRAGSPSRMVWIKNIDAGYLETFQIGLRAGRAFRATDGAGAPPVALLNAAAARLFFPDRDPLGQTLTLPGMRPVSPNGAQVVGIVGDVLQRDLTMEAYPEILIPAAQQLPAPSATIAVRATASSAAIIVALRQSLRATDPSLAATRLEAMDAVVDASLARHTFLLWLLVTFAGLALALSVIGLYAIVSYLVSQRTLEIGVRIALGAQRHHVLGLVLGEGALLVMIGVGIGIPAALGLSRFLGGFLYEVKAHDVATFAVGPIVLAVVALIAAYVPARRAASLDPAITLRAE